MARDGVAVRADVASAVARYVGPDRRWLNVAATCRELGISTKTFYKYVGRYRERGVAGLFPDSRRPHTNPTRLPTALEEVLVRLRKQEMEQGWDYGADAVLMRLEEQRQELWTPERALPSRATINRVFDARGLLAKTPQRKPRRRPRRFARDHANALWQFDGFEYTLADRTIVVVLELTDDCSRVDLALQAAVSENGEAIWQTFCTAAERYGLPTQVLTDNGSAFSGKRRGWISDFERALAEVSVEPICSSIAHPQTCGKNERSHQRVQKWLKHRPAAPTLTDLQNLLDTYRDGYNHRRNRVLGKLTPLQRFELGPRAFPTPFDAPTHVSEHRVSTRGTVCLDQVQIGIGRKHHAKTATVFRTGDYVAIFIDDHLARETVIDHTLTYQGRNR